MIQCEGDAFPCRHKRNFVGPMPDGWTYEKFLFANPRVRCQNCTTDARNRVALGIQVQRDIAFTTIGDTQNGQL